MSWSGISGHSCERTDSQGIRYAWPVLQQPAVFSKNLCLLSQKGTAGEHIQCGFFESDRTDRVSIQRQNCTIMETHCVRSYLHHGMFGLRAWGMGCWNGWWSFGSGNVCSEGKSTTISAHSGTVRSVRFASNGRMLLTASDDKTVKIWALPTQRFMFTLSGHMNWVRTAEFSPDCRLAVSGGDDKTMRLWDIGSKQLLRLYDDNQSVINSVAFHPDGTCIAAAGTDKVIRVWDIRCSTFLLLYRVSQTWLLQ